ncbi:MAG: PEP/pyruvate-binding domain-containing protein [Pseudomonadota bacterium]
MNIPKILSLSHYLKKGKWKEPSLKEKFRAFQTLLKGNNSALEIMGDMEEKYSSGEYIFDRQYIRASYSQIRSKVFEMVEALNQMVPQQYEPLYTIFEQVDQTIQRTVFGRKEIPYSPLTLSLDKVTKDMMEQVGGKNANLGEIRNRVGLPVPDGFAITSYAYKVFIEENKLEEQIRKQLNSLGGSDLEAIASASRKIQQAILMAKIPPPLEKAILTSYEKLTTKAGQVVPISIRSSAVGEDSEVTFAGQYATALNVHQDNILQTYKEIVASKFTPRAIFYWKDKGFNEEDIAMSVGCLIMIPSRTSGIIYSQDPNNPSPQTVIISAVWGLGQYAVSGQVSPNVYVLSREDGRILEKRIPKQEVMLVCHELAGEVEVAVPEEYQGKACLDDEVLKQLFNYALKLENHYQKPQDIEWAIDGAGNLFILQTRPLKISLPQDEMKEPSLPEIAPERLLIDWGVVASTGVGAGPVYLVKQDQDLIQFPEGAVLVVKHTAPKYVTVMNRAAAIITDIGNVTGHMASLAREFQVPTIVDTREATTLLKPGQLVTVDAVRNKIYQGVIEELIEKEQKKEQNSLKQTAILKKLEEVLSVIVPLNLVDPKDESFKPQQCRTFHDLTRYIHEVSIQEMFRFNEMDKSSRHQQAKRLISDLPINLYIIDLDDGLIPTHKPRKNVHPEDITSIPMKALWRGLTHPGVSWSGMVEVDLKGFASVMLNTLSDSAAYGQTMGERSYALISKEYMNFSSRLAYHFSTVDTFCSKIKNNNYITFHFMGGGSSSERRARRAKFISGALRNLDFEVELKGDWLMAKLMKYECPVMEEKLDYLGRLMCCSRQLDMVMYSDSVVDWYIRAFGEGNYTFKRE